MKNKFAEFSFSLDFSKVACVGSENTRSSHKWVKLAKCSFALILGWRQKLPSTVSCMLVGGVFRFGYESLNGDRYKVTIKNERVRGREREKTDRQ